MAGMDCARGKHMEETWKESKEAQTKLHTGSNLTKIMGRDK